MHYSEAFEALGLVPGASPSAIRAAYLARAKTLHPDAGGSVAAFSALSAAHIAATAYAMTEPCPTCKGAGITFLARGLHSSSMTCGPCRGVGLRHR
jgi:DnaJ-class molecular chaperone